MKAPELASTVIAGMFGAALLLIINSLQQQPASNLTVGLTGFAVGAGVQIGVRLTGVS